MPPLWNYIYSVFERIRICLIFQMICACVPHVWIHVVVKRNSTDFNLHFSIKIILLVLTKMMSCVKKCWDRGLLHGAAQLQCFLFIRLFELWFESKSRLPIPRCYGFHCISVYFRSVVARLVEGQAFIAETFTSVTIYFRNTLFIPSIN